MAFGVTVIPFTLSTGATAGQFVGDASNGLLQSGFGTPTAAIVYLFASDTVDSFDSTEGAQISIGMTDGTTTCNARCFGKAGSVSRPMTSSGGVIGAVQSANSTIQVSLTFNSFVSDGIKLAYSATPDYAWRGYVVLFTGTENVAVDLVETDATTEDVNYIGFKPDVLFWVGTGGSNESFNTGNYALWHGATIRDTSDDSVAWQGFTTCESYADVNAYGRNDTSSSYGHITISTPYSRGIRVDSFDASGWNHTRLNSAFTTRSFVLSIALPAGVGVDAGFLSSSGTTGTKTISPYYSAASQAVLTAATGRVGVSTTYFDNTGWGVANSWSLGAAYGATPSNVAGSNRNYSGGYASNVHDSHCVKLVDNSSTDSLVVAATDLDTASPSFNFSTVSASFSMWWVAFEADAAGAPTRTCSGTVSTGSATCSGAVKVPIECSGTVSTGSATCTGSASVPIFASGAVSTGSATASGTAEFPWYCSGTVSTGSATCGGTAALPVFATGTPSISAATASGAAVVPNAATGTPSTSAATASGSAARTVPEQTANGSPSTQAATASGTAARTVPVRECSGAVSTGSPTAAGVATNSGVTRTANGTPSTQPPTASGTASRTIPTRECSGTPSVSAATSTGSASVPTSQTIIRPDGNVTQTNCTGGFAEIDEVSANDTYPDFAYGTLNATAFVLEITLENTGDPNNNNDHVVRYRVGKIDADESPPVNSTTQNEVTLSVQLYQGGTLIATDTTRTLGAWETFVWNLSSTDVANITDYNDLRLRFSTVNHGSGGPTANRRTAGVSWAEMQVPGTIPAKNASGTPSTQPMTASGSASANVFRECSGAVTVAAVTVSGDCSFDAGTFEATGSPSTTAAIISGDASYDGDRSCSGAVETGSATCSGVVQRFSPQFQCNGSVVAGPATATGSGEFLSVFCAGAVVTSKAIVSGSAENPDGGTPQELDIHDQQERIHGKVGI